jgi:hypothetical protein
MTIDFSEILTLLCKNRSRGPAIFVIINIAAFVNEEVLPFDAGIVCVNKPFGADLVIENILLRWVAIAKS